MLLLSAFCNIQTINNSAKEDILPMGYDEAQNENIKETTANSMLGADVSFLRDMNVDANEIMNQRQALLMTASEGIILTADVEEKDEGERLKLDWSSYGETDKVFRVFQKTEDYNEWQSITTVDLSKEDIEPIKVLNVYPVVREENSEVYTPIVKFTYTNGTTEDIPKSAILKVMMEGGTMQEGESTTKFEAYGKDPNTGKQIIQVTHVTSEEFNKNPNQIMEYDVTLFGQWPYNGNKNNQPDDNAVKVIEEYIKKGYGILAGKHTIGFSFKDYGLNKLRKYFNIEIGFQNWKEGQIIEGIDYQGGAQYNANNIEIIKKGLITDFLWKFEKGEKIIISNLNREIQSDIWKYMATGRNWGDKKCK